MSLLYWVALLILIPYMAVLAVVTWLLILVVLSYLFEKIYLLINPKVKPEE